MNYVIQNIFFQFNSYNYTPRLKNFLYFSNVKFFYFFSLFSYQNLFNPTWKSFNILYKEIFFFFFFPNKLLKYINKLDLNILSFKSNRMSYGYLFLTLYLSRKLVHIKNYLEIKFNISISNSIYIYNVFLFVFKFFNKILKKEIFKLLFFYNFKIIISNFYINNFFFVNSNDYIIIDYSFNLLEFFNGYFFNVHSI